MPPPVGHAELRALAMDAFPDAVSLADLDGVLLDVNAGFERVTGFAASEVIGRPGHVVLAPVDQHTKLAELRDAVLRMEPWHGELDYRTRGGRDYLGRVTVAPLALPGDDGARPTRPTHTVTVHRDITSFRREAEVAQRAAQNVRHILENLPDAVVVVRADQVLMANQAMAQLLGGAAPGALVGRRIAPIIAERDRCAVMAQVQLSMGATPGPLGAPLRAQGSVDEARQARLEARLLGGAGVVHVELTFVSMSFDDCPAVAIVAQDLSLLRQIDLRARSVERMIAIGTLAAGMAHEINTPVQYAGDSVHFLRDAFADVFAALGRYRALAMMRGGPAVEAARAADEEVDLDGLEAQIPAALDRTSHGLERVARVVGALKDFGRPGPEHAVPTDLDALIRSAAVVAASALEAVAVVELELGVSSPVVCVASSMKQVILELLSNASHAVAERVSGTSTRGRVRVASFEAAGLAHVLVEDSGPGIPEALRARVFDPFFTTKAVGRGTGQGLAIARSVVEGHDGRIWFETEVGVGTTFHLAIPVAGPASAHIAR